MKRLFLIPIFLLMICQVTAFGQRGIAGRSWTLTYLVGVEIGSVDAFLDIDKTGRRTTGNTGCNIMNGTVRVRGAAIDFGTTITTKRACTMETGRVEGAFLSALERARRYELIRGKLRLFAGRELIAEFEPRTSMPELTQTGPSRLVNRKWMLETIDGKPFPHVEQEPFISFDPRKESAGGNTSCNVFGGEFKATGDRFKFSSGIATMRACFEDERMDIERKFLENLRLADRFKITGDRLTLFRGRKELLTFKGQAK